MRKQKTDFKKFQEAHTHETEAEFEEDDFSDIPANTNHSQTVTASAKKSAKGGTAMGSFVPNTPDSYPHLHLVNNCVIYSASKHAKKIYLKSGDNYYKKHIDTVYAAHNTPSECRHYIDTHLRN